MHRLPGARRSPPVRAVLLVGVGAAGDRRLPAAGAALARAFRDREVLATTVTGLADDAGLRAFVVGLMLGVVRVPLALGRPEGTSRYAGCSLAATRRPVGGARPRGGRSAAPAGGRGRWPRRRPT